MRKEPQMLNVEQVYLFTGTEEVRSRAKMEAIIQSLHPAPITVTRYDLDVTNISQVVNDAITIPFLAEYKVIVVKNPKFLTGEKTSIHHDLAYFIQYLKKPTETTILMIDAIGLKIAPDNEVFKVLQKCSYIKDTQKLDDVEFKAWVTRLLPAEQVSIRPDALDCLVDYVKQNYVRMEQEVKKLASYVGKGGIITVNDVKKLVEKDLEGDIFSFIKAIVLKDRPTIIKMYQEFKAQTQDVMGIIAMIAKTFRELLTTLKLLKAGYAQHDIALFYEISDGRAFYLVRDAKTFELDTLEDYVKKMATLDYKIKSGQIDKNLGLELLLLSI